MENNNLLANTVLTKITEHEEKVIIQEKYNTLVKLILNYTDLSYKNKLEFNIEKDSILEYLKVTEYSKYIHRKKELEELKKTTESK